MNLLQTNIDETEAKKSILKTWYFYVLAMASYKHNMFSKRSQLSSSCAGSSTPASSTMPIMPGQKLAYKQKNPMLIWIINLVFNPCQ